MNELIKIVDKHLLAMLLSVVVIMPFWFVVWILFKPNMVFSEEWWIAIIFCFCFSVIWYILWFILATLRSILTGTTNPTLWLTLAVILSIGSLSVLTVTAYLVQEWIISIRLLYLVILFFLVPIGGFIYVWNYPHRIGKSSTENFSKLRAMEKKGAEMKKD